jgi:hypothetical protein
VIVMSAMETTLEQRTRSCEFQCRAQTNRKDINSMRSIHERQAIHKIHTSRALA